MRPAYVSVDLGDPDDNEPPRFTITASPLLYREGEPVGPSAAELKRANSYPELCAVLKKELPGSRRDAAAGQVLQAYQD